MFYLQTLFTTTLYLDPGSSSFILQLLVGGIAAGIFAFRGYFAQLKAFITRTPIKTEDELLEEAELEATDPLTSETHPEQSSTH